MQCEGYFLKIALGTRLPLYDSSEYISTFYGRLKQNYQDIIARRLKTFYEEDVLQKRLEYVVQTSWKTKNCYAKVLKTYWKTRYVCWDFLM